MHHLLRLLGVGSRDFHPRSLLPVLSSYWSIFLALHLSPSHISVCVLYFSLRRNFRHCLVLFSALSEASEKTDGLTLSLFPLRGFLVRRSCCFLLSLSGYPYSRRDHCFLLSLRLPHSRQAFREVWLEVWSMEHPSFSFSLSVAEYVCVLCDSLRYHSGSTHIGESGNEL